MRLRIAAWVSGRLRDLADASLSKIAIALAWLRVIIGAMASQFSIDPATSPDDLRDVAGLFRDYARSLPVDLDYQDFDAELAGIPGKYAAPAGALLLARDTRGTPIGCAALRPLGDGLCEMKRLFVAPAARGLGLGVALVRAIVAAARERDYAELRLDTLPTMDRALALYHAMGFSAIAPYYGPTPPGAVFLALALKPSR